ncbi:MAG: M4 family metallopeptidase [Pseudomonadaceae bacterium]|nr:M4 family metallopeptidase [Pseudomonadaceae bacterium]
MERKTLILCVFGCAAIASIATGYLWFHQSAPKSFENLAASNVDPNEILLALNGKAKPLSATRQQSLRQIPQNANTVTPEEAIAAVKANVSELTDYFQRGSESAADQAIGPKLDPKKEAQLRVFEETYSSSGPSTLSFDHNRNLSAIFLKSPLAIVKKSTPDQVSNDIAEIVGQHADLFGLGAEGEIGNVSTICSAAICNSRVEKLFNGLPAWDHGLVVSTSEQGMYAAIGEFNEPQVPKTTPKVLSNSEILAEIAQYFADTNSNVAMATEPELGIAREGGHDFVGYRVTVDVGDFKKFEVYLDAATSNIVRALPLTYEVAVPASGTDLNGETVQFEADQVGSTFSMVDTRFPVGFQTTIFSAPNSDLSDPVAGASVVTSGNANSGWDSAAVSALENVRILVDYYANTHGYAAVNENGKDVRVVVNGNYSNAIASGDDLFLFGAGNGTTERNWAASLDVMAHEITHGVISTTSNLAYRNQSGALNESFADFFGAAVDPEDWRVGEDVFVGSQNFIRSLANPSLRNQPSHFANYVRTSADNGGVHINSGIPNRAHYLLAEGLSLEGLGTSVGRAVAESISFATLQSLDRNATFLDAALMMEAVAVALFGVETPQVQAVRLAWEQVGIPSDDTTIGSAGSNPPQIQGRNAVIYLSPISDPSTVPVEENTYGLYLQLYDNQSPTYSPDDNVGPLNNEPAAFTRPSQIVFEDGSLLVIFRGTDGEVYLLNPNSGQAEPLDLSGLDDLGLTVADLTVTPDGEMLVFTFQEAPVIFAAPLFSDDEPVFFTVTGPSYTEGAPSIPVEFVDTVRVDPTSRKIVFDYATCATEDASGCNDPDATRYWSIGTVDLASGQIAYPFPSQAERFDLGYPSFSNLTDRYLVFDIIDNQAETASGVESIVVIYDQELGDLNIIGPSDITTARLGANGSPSFSADDSRVTFAVRVDGPGSAMVSAELEDYRLADVENPYSDINPFNAFLPFSIPTVNSSPNPSLLLDPSLIDFGEVSQGDILTAQLCGRNESEFPIEIGELATNLSLSWTGSNNYLGAAEEICGTLRLDTSNINTAAFESVFSVRHDGANSPTPVSISATIDVDTDGDGLLDSVDLDDDGDGLSDLDEINVYGTDPLLSDTDRDSLSDGYEVNNDLNPLDPNDCPEDLCPPDSFLLKLLLISE